MPRISKPIRSVQDVLTDLLDDNRRRLQRHLDRCSDDCLYWMPTLETNSIAVTIWHMGRLLDVFLFRQALGYDVEEECWFQKGWMQQTGYDPRGIGRDGWGSLNDYTSEEVAAMPRMSRHQLLGYLDDVYTTTKEYLGSISDEELQALAPGFEGRFTRYQCIQMALMDNVRHLGEIIALIGRWERESKNV
ncbi:MAG: DinB family protein [Anaerolineales bacterium]|jgi:hypothetical protein